MAGLAVGLTYGRREVVAAGVGVVCAVVIGLAWDSRAGVVAGGLIGPLVGLAIPTNRPARALDEVATERDDGLPS
jgi:hypothetical protein